MPFKDGGCLKPHAHHGPAPFLYGAKLPLVLDERDTEVPKGLSGDHAQAPRGHREDGLRGVTWVIRHLTMTATE